MLDKGPCGLKVLAKNKFKCKESLFNAVEKRIWELRANIVLGILSCFFSNHLSSRFQPSHLLSGVNLLVRKPQGLRPASASRQTWSSGCSTGSPASQSRSHCLPLEQRNPGRRSQSVHTVYEGIAYADLSSSLARMIKTAWSVIVKKVTLVATQLLSSPTLPSSLFQHSTRVVWKKSKKLMNQLKNSPSLRPTL